VPAGRLGSTRSTQRRSPPADHLAAPSPRTSAIFDAPLRAHAQRHSPRSRFTPSARLAALGNPDSRQGPGATTRAKDYVVHPRTDDTRAAPRLPLKGESASKVTLRWPARSTWRRPTRWSTSTPAPSQHCAVLTAPLGQRASARCRTLEHAGLSRRCGERVERGCSWSRAAVASHTRR